MNAFKKHAICFAALGSGSLRQAEWRRYARHQHHNCAQYLARKLCGYSPGTPRPPPWHSCHSTRSTSLSSLDHCIASIIQALAQHTYVNQPPTRPQPPCASHHIHHMHHLSTTYRTSGSVTDVSATLVATTIRRLSAGTGCGEVSIF